MTTSTHSAVAKPVYSVVTAHKVAPDRTSSARRGRRWASAAIGSGDRLVARVRTTSSSAIVPSPMPRLRLISGMRTMNA